MALPPEHRTPRMAMLEAIVDATPRERLMDFPVLEPQDHQLIGIFIQQFNYIDFNLRRAIETFARANLLRGDAAKTYPKIHSSKVSVAVQEAVVQMDAAIEDIPDTTWKSTLRQYRNTGAVGERFAHPITKLANACPPFPKNGRLAWAQYGRHPMFRTSAS
jgi:hypothetical protein